MGNLKKHRDEMEARESSLISSQQSCGCMTHYSMSSQSCCFCLSAVNHLPVSQCRSLNSNEGRRCHCKLLAVSPPEGTCSAYLSAPEEPSVNVLRSDSCAWQRLHQQHAFSLGDGQMQVSSWGSPLPWLCYCSGADWKREDWPDPSASLQGASLSKVQAGPLGQGLELAPVDIPAPALQALLAASALLALAWP